MIDTIESHKYHRLYDKLVNKYVNIYTVDLQSLYTEKHHIIPKCMGGSNHKHNIVRIPARVHFLLHWMLCRMYPTNIKLIHAFFKMTHKTSVRGRYTSKSFQYARELKSNLMKTNPIMHNETYKQKCVESRKGYTHSPETRLKISQSKIGKSPSPEANLKNSIANSGVNNAFYGKTHSEETRLKMKLAWEKRKLTEQPRDSGGKFTKPAIY